ncbi:MAG: hypothetical protein E7253_08755 [Lachnospiraceae bacterium]|nr:hypothetical protein [Lachnospiraceae bacterium]
MRRRREKGLVIVLVIIAVCLFFMIRIGGPFSMPKTSGEDPELNLNSELLKNDISVADSLEMQAEDALKDSMVELTFLVNHFSFERGGSQVLIGVAAGLLIFYLILIGPVAYFYLKKIRRMERMWIILPALSLIFGCIILLMSNDFIIREPFADVIKVISPGRQTVCYGVVTSPGEESFSLYFEDRVHSLQTLASASDYVINEERRSLTIYPDSAFEKAYFQFYITQMHDTDFIHTIEPGGQTGKGMLYNTTGYSFTHVMLCYGDYYCILPAMDPGEEINVTEDMWKKDEIGMTGSLKEELQMQNGLSGDEEEVFQFAWYLHANEEPYKLHMAGISKEGDAGLKEAGVDLISYSMFYR